jgi:hypothetical protein
MLTRKDVAAGTERRDRDSLAFEVAGERMSWRPKSRNIHVDAGEQDDGLAGVDSGRELMNGADGEVGLAADDGVAAIQAVGALHPLDVREAPRP